MTAPLVITTALGCPGPHCAPRASGRPALLATPIDEADGTRRMSLECSAGCGYWTFVAATTYTRLTAAKAA